MSAKELMLLHCGSGEDSWESLDIKIKPVRPKGKSTLNIHGKDCCWSWSSNTLAIWCKELTHWKRPWCSERLRAGRKGDDRGWDGWMASQTRWAWVWVNSEGWWCLACCYSWGRKDWDTTEWLNWTELKITTVFPQYFQTLSPRVSLLFKQP